MTEQAKLDAATAPLATKHCIAANGQIIEACEARRKVKNAEDGDDILSIMLRIKDEEEFEFPFNITHIKAVITVSVVAPSLLLI